ncbi:unnamed protein product [Peniophora sp. CBMAI 1063]|nr:unnamed protein product [Peniophora sp. CBMAI 1063]
MSTKLDRLIFIARQELGEIARAEAQLEDEKNARKAPSWTKSAQGDDSPHKLKLHPVSRSRRKAIGQAPPGSLLSTPSSSTTTLVLDSFTPLTVSPPSIKYESDDDVDMLEDDTLEPPTFPVRVPQLLPQRPIAPCVQCQFGSACGVRFTHGMNERTMKEHLDTFHNLAAAMPQSQPAPWPAQVELIDALNPVFIRHNHAPGASVPPQADPTATCSWSRCRAILPVEDLPGHVAAHVNAVWTSNNGKGVQWRWVACEP